MGKGGLHIPYVDIMNLCGVVYRPFHWGQVNAKSTISSFIPPQLLSFNKKRYANKVSPDAQYATTRCEPTLLRRVWCAHAFRNVSGVFMSRRTVLHVTEYQLGQARDRELSLNIPPPQARASATGAAIHNIILTLSLQLSPPPPWRLGPIPRGRPSPLPSTSLPLTLRPLLTQHRISHHPPFLPPQIPTPPP